MQVMYSCVLTRLEGYIVVPVGAAAGTSPGYKLGKPVNPSENSITQLAISAKEKFPLAEVVHNHTSGRENMLNISLRRP